MSLADVLHGNPSTVVLGEALRAGGLFGMGPELMSRFGPDRVLDLPVADRAMVGVAVGMAWAGKVPIVELSATARLAAVSEPLRELGQAQGTVVIRVPYGQDAGALDAALSDVLGLGIRVWCANSPDAAVGYVAQACDLAGPTVILEPRGHGAGVPAATAPVSVAKAGQHGTIVTWGAQIAAAIEASDTLASEGLAFRVVELVQLCPLNGNGGSASALATHLRETGRLIVLHPNDDDLAARVVASIVDHAFLYLESPPARVTSTRALLDAAREAATW